MTTNPLLGRVTEIAATYMIHSTVLLGLAWIALHFISRRRTKSWAANPGIVEAIWKLAALLPLFTAPLCVQANLGSRYLTYLIDFDSAVRQRSPINRPSVSIGNQVATNSTQESVVADSTELIDIDDDKNLLSYSELKALAEPSTLGQQIPEIIQPAQMKLIDDDTAGELALTSKILERTPITFPIDSSVRTNHRVLPNTIELFAMAFLGWCVIQFARLIWLAVSLNRWLRSCKPAPMNLKQQLEQILPRNLKVELLQANDSNSRQYVLPFACGVWTNAIVLPQGIEHRISKVELRALLAHEVAHLMRRDPVWQWIGQFLCTCFAIQPLNFVARSDWQEAAELLCDDWAIEQKIAPTELARCLTTIAEWQIDTKTNRFPKGSLGVPAVGNIGSLTNRVEWLLRRRSNSSRFATRRRIAFSLFALLLAVTFGTTGPRFILTPASVVFANEQPNDVTPMTPNPLQDELQSARRELDELQQLLKPIADSQIDTVLSGIRLRLEQIKSELP